MILKVKRGGDIYYHFGICLNLDINFTRICYIMNINVLTYPLCYCTYYKCVGLYMSMQEYDIIFKHNCMFAIYVLEC